MAPSIDEINDQIESMSCTSYYDIYAYHSQMLITHAQYECFLSKLSNCVKQKYIWWMQNDYDHENWIDHRPIRMKMLKCQPSHHITVIENLLVQNIPEAYKKKKRICIDIDIGLSFISCNYRIMINSEQQNILEMLHFTHDFRWMWITISNQSRQWKWWYALHSI